MEEYHIVPEGEFMVVAGTGRMKKFDWTTGQSIWIPWMMKSSHSHQRHESTDDILLCFSLIEQMEAVDYQWKFSPNKLEAELV